MIPKAVRVLKILMSGGEIKHNGRRWVMSEDNCLCVVANNETTGEEVLLYAMNDSLDRFIEWAEALPEDTIFLAAAGVVLTEIRQGGM